MMTATTAIDGTEVIITWSKPESRGSPITSYAVYIEDSDGNMDLYEENCLGTLTGVLYDNTCAVPLSTLKDPAQFNLA